MSADPQAKTRSQREYARKRRHAQWLQAAALLERCPAMLTRGHPCTTPLESRFVDGETVPFCPTCDRKARGVCVDCHTAPVDGTPRMAIRCALCKKLARQAADARHRQKYAGSKRWKARQYARDHQPSRLEYKRLYRQARPAKVAAQKQASYARNREQALAYHAGYRARHRAERAERERLRLRGDLPPRTCLTCDTVLRGRAKKCPPCKQAARRFARAAITERLERAA